MNAFELTHQALMSNVIDDKIKLTQQLQSLSIDQKLNYTIFKNKRYKYGKIISF